MTLVIIVILLLGLLLIASAHLTHVNKAAIAVFMGTVCWVLYICYGTDYVMSFHQLDYLGFLLFLSKIEEYRFIIEIIVLI